MSKPLLIGLGGKAGAGKSTAADYLERYHGYHQFAFADALKEVVGLAFRLDVSQLYGARKETVDPRWGRSPRQLLQWLGTDVLRAQWPEIWISHLRHEMLDFLSQNGQQPIVVSDVRFLDEAEALRRVGATLIRLERPGAGGAGDHVSETDLDGWEGWDRVIVNNGSLEALYGQVEVVIKAPSNS